MQGPLLHLHQFLEHQVPGDYASPALPLPAPGELRVLLNSGESLRLSKACVHAQSLQSCPTLCSCMDSSLPGSSVHGII